MIKKVLFIGASARDLGHLKSGLVAGGYEARLATTSVQVWQAVMQQQLDGIILHTGASSTQLDPWRLIAELSALNHVPLIVLTRAGRKQDRVRAYNAGARHCLTLPTSCAELCACLNSIWLSGPAAVPALQIDYVDAEVQIDFTNRQIRRDGQIFPLTGREYPLLLRVLQNRGKMIPGQELCQAVWGEQAWPQKRNLLKTYILQLRRKIEREACHPRYLISQRGMGYAFMPREG